MFRSSILFAVIAASAASAQTNLHTYYGQADFGLGAAVAAAGDVDGDGVGDILVSAPRETSSGTVRVYSGATGALLYSVHNTIVTNNFGFALASIGDVDGDGRPDFAVGDTDETGPGWSGSVRVFSGADGHLLYMVHGYSTTSFFGESLAGIGDVDGDGYPDLLVGSFFDTSFANYGSARLFSGHTGTLIFSIGNTPQTQYCGSAVSALGDVDGDGVPDFAVSAHIVSGQGFAYNGRVSVFSGATFAVLYEIYGPADNALIGLELEPIGDIDGDGVPDLLVGAEGQAGTMTTGWAYAYSGVNGALLYSLRGDSIGDHFGAHLAGVGDVDQDGRPDFAISARYGDYIKVFSGATGALLYDMREANDGWSSPLSVAGLGDLNGDGRPEIAVGKGTDSKFGHFSGKLRIVSDGSTPPTGSSLCFGDGSSGPCPCGNSASSGEGCANSLGVGAMLAAQGTTSIVDDLLVLPSHHMTPYTLSVMFVGTSTTPAVFAGDGLRCIGGTIKRVETTSSNQAGLIWFGPGLLATLNASPGATRHFQAFYRNPTGPCANFYNTSNAVSVVLTN